MKPHLSLITACAGALALAACGPNDAQGASPAAAPAASVARSVEAPPAAAALAAPAAQEVQEKAAAAPAPSAIVLITLDTLRRDHLGCYGYFRDTSPRMDAFAAQSVVFERALATAASTFPSHLSMLTGLYPHQHGRTSNLEGVEEPFVSAPGCASLALALREAGWRTAGFVSSRVLAEDTGIADGFETYWCPGPRGNPARAETTTDRALAWLESEEPLEPDAPARPIFLWVHLWDTHEPNDPPDPYAGMFTADERLSERIAASGIDVELLREKFGAKSGIPQRFFGDARAERAKSLAERREEELQRKRRKRKPEESEIDQQGLLDLWNRYDACVRYFDDQVGRILDALAARGLADRTIVAIVADHGQSLGENASLGHGKITNVNTFVPFLLRIPGVEARRDPRLVSMVDLAPTLLARLGPDFPAPLRTQFEGTDVLASDFARPHVLVEEASEFHGTSARAPRCALFEGRWKYLFSAEGNELYDLEGAGEGVDVLAQNWDDAVRLHAKVQELLARRPESQVAAPVSEERAKELLEELEKMGYAGDE